MKRHQFRAAGAGAAGRLAAAAAVFALALPGLRAQAAGQAPADAPGPEAAARISFDMVVIDRDGRAPDRLGPNDVSVSVAGRPRAVTAIRRVSRGPGAAADAASRLASVPAGGAWTFASEASRAFVVIVDETGIMRGQERQAVTASRLFLDRLGMGDRVAALVLPLTGSQLLSLTTDQPEVRAALSGVTGRILPSLRGRPEPAITAPEPGSGLRDEPEPPPQPLRTDQPGMPNLDTARLGAGGGLGGLAGVLEAMRSMPGRKTVAFFSAGTADLPLARVHDVAAAAVAARTAVYAFGLSGGFDASESGLDARPLEALAQATGGRFVALGRNPERAIGRTAAELSSCYVVELEAAADDAGPQRRELKVTLEGRGWTVRAPAWLAPTEDPGDTPAAAAVEPPVDERAAAAPKDERRNPAPPSAGDAARASELQLAMGRLFDYVEAYERQYSGLVAEEDYQQSTRSGDRVRIRSDYLLVKLQGPRGWESFRDVYEVNGVAVRDRDDRLRRLFLEPGSLVEGQLQAIKNESARHNIGLVERNINVPLFTLRFLSPENRDRFHFKLAGRREVDGIGVWRIEYEETGRPTIITDLGNRDVPAKGWFLVDQTTGAIVESRLRAEERGTHGEILVTFRQDPELGMWVPEKMSETYRSVIPPSGRDLARTGTVQQGTATYSKFRRFVVRTEETIAIPR
ncbi:MAG TPA: hypothetical protein PLN93_00950 [Vicinamibacterales bacterium]|nr:hypothetical protein [Vicinamibacterales bacterium]HOQ59074.1 hypothetical protein [Vicinamibacterales bacterium]HPK70483.1 hypothetical protein [Vicinamibacterales bacterium]